MVLQVLPALRAGGVERGTVEMAQAIAGAGGTAWVASAGGRMVPEVGRAGGHHVILPLAAKDPWTIWRNAGRLAALVRQSGARIVHARSRAPAWSALWAARRTGAHFVTTYHGVYSETLPGKRWYNAVMARGERVIAISEHVARQVRLRHGVGEDRLRVIPRGADVVAFDPATLAPGRLVRLAEAWRLPAEAPVIMLPGRLSRWKGQRELVQAFAAMRHRDAVLVLVGETAGRERMAEYLRRLALGLGVADRLRLVGHCDDMPAAMRLASVVVSGSLLPEPFGRVVVQAMERLVIATDHGGAAETVEHGVTGWRVAPLDRPAMAAALDHALDLPAAERDARGRAARDSVCRRYTVAAMQAATLDVYRELL